MPAGRVVSDLALQLCENADLVTEYKNNMTQQTKARNDGGQGKTPEIRKEAKAELGKLQVRRDELVDLIHENVNARCLRERGCTIARLKKQTADQAKDLEKMQTLLTGVKRRNEDMASDVGKQHDLEKAETASSSTLSPATLAAEKAQKDAARKQAQEQRAAKKQKKEDDEKKKDPAAFALKQKAAADEAEKIKARQAAAKAKASAKKAAKAAETAAVKAKAAKSAEEAAEKAKEAAEKEAAEKAKEAAENQATEAAENQAKEAAENQANEAAEKATEAEKSSESSALNFKVGDKVQHKKKFGKAVGEVKEVHLNDEGIRTLKIDWGTRHDPFWTSPGSVHFAAGK